MVNTGVFQGITWRTKNRQQLCLVMLSMHLGFPSGHDVMHPNTPQFCPGMQRGGAGGGGPGGGGSSGKFYAEIPEKLPCLKGLLLKTLHKG